MKRNATVLIADSGSVSSPQKGHGHTALSVTCRVTATHAFETPSDGLCLEKKKKWGV